MATHAPDAPIGVLLREWRERRRRTQLDLALDAGVSARHLSFVETGRSRPGAEVILRIAEHLELPLRERNRLLLAAGYAPAFPDRSLEAPEMRPTKLALEHILAQHEPYPAMVIDRRWDLVSANQAASVLADMVDPRLLIAPVNVMRAGLHPDGLSRWIVNLGEVRSYFTSLLRHQIDATADPELIALLDEIDGYPSPERDARAERDDGSASGTIRMRAPDGNEYSFFGLFATFNAPFDVASSELAIELAYPADPFTAQALRELASARR
ncbi:MAG TPA: helix-turn-helix transcriptional regulator [Solirubrobacteraceae bacterium]|nr:helix-turn-helix transcriptional regulator [Solirubrobacteraceae bacterium]